MSKVGIIYWSSTGNTEAMAQAVEEGAKAAGADFFQKKITRSRKIITPGKIKHLRRILLRDLFCSV